MANYERAVCKDGFVISIQAGSFLYCTPREDGARRYTEVELGFPSKRESLIMEYAEESSRPTETVYPYVPVELVDRVIAKHGGLRSRTPLPPGVQG
jgi:hypothetical protein